MTDSRPIPPPPPARRLNPATGRPVRQSRRVTARPVPTPIGNDTARQRRADSTDRQSYRWWHNLMQPGYGR